MNAKLMLKDIFHIIHIGRSVRVSVYTITTKQQRRLLH